MKKQLRHVCSRKGCYTHIRLSATPLFRIVADRCTSWWPSFRRWRREQSCCRHSFSRGRRTDERDGFSLVSAIDAEILAVHSDDAVARIKLGHTDKTKVGEV